MKVRVLYPSAFGHLDPVPVGSDVVDLPEAEAKSYIDAGYCEAVAEKKVERATKAPGESRATREKP